MGSPSYRGDQPTSRPTRPKWLPFQWAPLLTGEISHGIRARSRVWLVSFQWAPLLTGEISPVAFVNARKSSSFQWAPLLTGEISLSASSGPSSPGCCFNGLPFLQGRSVRHISGFWGPIGQVSMGSPSYRGDQVSGSRSWNWEFHLLFQWAPLLTGEISQAHPVAPCDSSSFNGLPFLQGRSAGAGVVVSVADAACFNGLPFLQGRSA